MPSGKPELDAIVAALTTAAANEITKVNSCITQATNAISHLLQKIAAGSPDLQSDVDQLKTIQGNLDAASAALDSAIASFKLEGN